MPQGRIIGSVTKTPVDIDITYPALNEYNYASPDAMTTTEPVNAQISYTLQAGDFPTVTGIGSGSVDFTALLYVALRYPTSTGSATVSYRFLKNGSSVVTGTTSALASLNYGTLCGPVYNDIAVGDVISLKLWSTSASTTINWRGIAVYPTGIRPGTDNKAIIDLKFTTVITYPTFTLGGAPAQASNSAFYVYNGAKSSAVGEASATYPAIQCGDTIGLFKVGYGDYNFTSTTWDTSPTARPSYRVNRAPTNITYTPTEIETNL